MTKTAASTQLNQARARRAPRLTFFCAGPSRTKQNFTAECDINSIMTKFEKTGVIDHVREHGASYGDFLSLPVNYQEACNQVIAAGDMFASLPSKVRKAFDNDPGDFLAAIDAAQTDPAVRDRLVKLGLLQTNEPSGSQQGASGEPATPPEGGNAPDPE